MPGYSATPAASGYRKRLIGIDMLFVQRKWRLYRRGNKFTECRFQYSPTFLRALRGELYATYF